MFTSKLIHPSLYTKQAALLATWCQGGEELLDDTFTSDYDYDESCSSLLLLLLLFVDPSVPAKVPIYPAPPLMWGRDG
jgi:hypothetical protein